VGTAPPALVAILEKEQPMSEANRKRISGQAEARVHRRLRAFWKEFPLSPYELDPAATQQPRAAREFKADDARAIARCIIESDAGRRCCWSASAVETVAAIILWEICKPKFGDAELISQCPCVPGDVLASLHPDPMDKGRVP
jgi:hypothetical protein